MKKFNYPLSARVYQNTTKTGVTEFAIFESDNERRNFINQFTKDGAKSPFTVCSNYKRADGKDCYPVSVVL